MSIVLAILGSKIGRGALIGLSVLIALWAWGQKKEREGYNACKVEWSEAEAAMARKTEESRREAEEWIRNNPSTPGEPDSDRVLQNDKYNRDRNGV